VAPAKKSSGGLDGLDARAAPISFESVPPMKIRAKMSGLRRLGPSMVTVPMPSWSNGLSGFDSEDAS
jgi:hypothetical protein